MISSENKLHTHKHFANMNKKKIEKREVYVRRTNVEYVCVLRVRRKTSVLFNNKKNETASAYSQRQLMELHKKAKNIPCRAISLLSSPLFFRLARTHSLLPMLFFHSPVWHARSRSLSFFVCVCPFYLLYCSIVRFNGWWMRVNEQQKKAIEQHLCKLFWMCVFARSAHTKTSRLLFTIFFLTSILEYLFSVVVVVASSLLLFNLSV